jgi:hypothetical protein
LFLRTTSRCKLNQHALDSIQSTSGSIELVDVSSRPNNWEDFIEAWIQNRVKFNQNEVYEEVYDNSIVKQWYPVHPKGSSNRRWMEEKMMSDIKHILNKKMSRLLKINKNWYLLDMNVEPTEGSVVIFEELVVAYATFVNVEKQLCVINNGNNLLNVTFSEVESVIASTNSNDSKPMLNLFDIEKLILETYIFNTISNEFGVEYPDEDDSIMGYYKTNQES